MNQTTILGESAMNERIIKDAIDYIKQIFQHDYSGHDPFHTLRVYQMATTIAQQEKADVMIVQLAALLHDVDDIKLSPKTHLSKDNAVNFLNKHHVSTQTIKIICDIIENVSYSGTDSVIPPSMEGKCVQDADRLDAMGAIGIARAFAYGGNHNRAIYDPNIPYKENMNKTEYQNNTSTTINHFYEKLFQLHKQMNTKTAKAISKKREAFMKTYISEFLAEWDGIR